jgi:hypothetical protein
MALPTRPGPITTAGGGCTRAAIVDVGTRRLRPSLAQARVLARGGAACCTWMWLAVGSGIAGAGGGR